MERCIQIQRNIENKEIKGHKQDKRTIGRNENKASKFL